MRTYTRAHYAMCFANDIKRIRPTFVWRHYSANIVCQTLSFFFWDTTSDFQLWSRKMSRNNNNIEMYGVCAPKHWNPFTEKKRQKKMLLLKSQDVSLGQDEIDSFANKNTQVTINAHHTWNWNCFTLVSNSDIFSKCNFFLCVHLFLLLFLDSYVKVFWVSWTSNFTQFTYDSCNEFHAC